MKNKLLLCILLLAAVTMNAQVDLIDMDEASGAPDALLQTIRGNGNTALISLVDNATEGISGGLNTSANSVKFVETTGSVGWNGMQLKFQNGTTQKTGYSLNSLRFVKFLVYSKDRTDFSMTFIAQSANANFSLKKNFTVALNTWTEVIFDLTGNNSNAVINNAAAWNSLFRVVFNQGVAGDGSTYYVDQVVLDEPNYKTVADGDWSTAANWNPANVPALVGDKVDINHNITHTGNVSIREMLIRVNKSLNITGDLTVANKSNLWAGSSLIVSGTATGEFAYYRVIAEPAVGALEGWHLVSSPVSGEQYDDAWISAYSIASGTGSNRGIATYNNSGVDVGRWDFAQAPVSATNFMEGQGYFMKSTGGGTAQFTGSLRTADVTNIALTVGSTNAYNLVGNPFTGYVSATDLMGANGSLLTEATIWIWNPAIKDYDAKVGGFQIAPGQGFFVEAAAAAPNFTINTSMLSSQTADTFLKSSKTEIQLNITDGDLSRYAKINYLNNATTSFDNGYDGKLFGGTEQSLAVYTHLLSNNEEKKYQIQALPNSDLETMVIPVGLNAAAGKEITFTADALNLPSGLKVFLEDRNTNTFTRLDEAGANYNVTLSKASNGVGRFYLHTTQSVLSVDTALDLNNINIYKADNKTLSIVGLQQGKANVKLYNILGKQIMNAAFESNGVRKDISLPNLAIGVYIVQLQSEAGKLNKKIIIE